MIAKRKSRSGGDPRWAKINSRLKNADSPNWCVCGVRRPIKWAYCRMQSTGGMTKLSWISTEANKNKENQRREHLGPGAKGPFPFADFC